MRHELLSLLTLACGASSVATGCFGGSNEREHTDFAGMATIVSGSDQRDRDLVIGTDDCVFAKRLSLNVGPRCELEAAWSGQPYAGDRYAGHDVLQEGAMSIGAGQRCVLELAPGDPVAVRVERGTAVITVNVIQVSLDGVLTQAHRADPAGARASFRFTGSFRASAPSPRCSD